MKRQGPYILRALLAFAAAGCATSVAYAPAHLEGISRPDRQITLLSSSDVSLDTGYRRTLAAGSKWIRIGVIQRGDVYRPLNSVFTLEGANVHEAYLVISGNDLVGFYMPVEQGFSSIHKSMPLIFNTSVN